MLSKLSYRLLLCVSTAIATSLTTLLLFSVRPAAAQCTAPNVGDWVIDTDCTLLETQAAPQNVILQNQAELTIPANVRLGVGFDDHYLWVEDGSRIMVENGGQIATNRCPEIDPELLNAPYRFQYNLTASSLTDNYYSGLQSQGYRPHRLTGYLRGNEVRFATDWIQIDGPERPSDFDLLDIDFEQRFSTLAATHRLIDVSAYNFPGGEARFADIWVENSAGLAWQVHPADTLSQVEQRIAELAPQGLVPVRVEAYQDGSETRYLSLWVAGNCKWVMDPQMTLSDYASWSTTYSTTYRQEHVEQYTQNGNVYYAAIWYQRPVSDPVEPVWVNTDWYLFQRNLNNIWCNGFRLANFYAADHPNGIGGARYGGIWTFDSPRNVITSSPLSLKVQQEINCAIGRGGAAIVRVNADTGAVEDEIYHHADQVYGISSVSKIAILYSLLRRIDATPGVTLGTTISVGTQYGSNDGNQVPCLPGTCIPAGTTDCTTGNTGLIISGTYGLGCLAQLMIRVSHNWATNRLIDYVTGHQPGVITVPVNSPTHQINQDMQALGLPNTQVRRYMTGGGSQPSPFVAHQMGEEVTSTPLELVTLLRLIDQNNGLLSDTSDGFFWNTLNLSGISQVGVIDDIFATALNNGTFSWTSAITIENKRGGNSWSGGNFIHRPQSPLDGQRSEAGRLNIDTDGDGDTDSQIYFALSINEAYITGPTPVFSDALLQSTVSCIGAQVARAYTGQSSGTDLTTLSPPCWSP